MKVAIVSGSMFGTAEEVARHARQLLTEAGFDVFHETRPTLDQVLGFAPAALLGVTSTTGMGELPDDFQPLFHEIRDRFPAWSGLPFGVISLGDSSYGDTYGGAGRQLQELLLELGMREQLPLLQLDASETVSQDTDSEPWLADFIDALRQARR